MSAGPQSSCLLTESWRRARVPPRAGGGLLQRAAGAERHVQPLREHLSLTDEAGNRYECAWLKGGTAVEDPSRLRFQAGFPLPAAAARKVSLTFLLPQPQALRP